MRLESFWDAINECVAVSRGSFPGIQDVQELQGVKWMQLVGSCNGIEAQSMYICAMHWTVLDGGAATGDGTLGAVSPFLLRRWFEKRPKAPPALFLLGKKAVARIVTNATKTDKSEGARDNEVLVATDDEDLMMPCNVSSASFWL